MRLRCPKIGDDSSFLLLLPVVPQNLVYALTANTGTIVRIGGTSADYSYYVPGSTNASGGDGHTIISDAILDSVFSFAAQTHATILWDFNGRCGAGVAVGS